jgi:uncharacterized membrane protein YdjX (TVP38/TMEM64 family)
MDSNLNAPEQVHVVDTVQTVGHVNVVGVAIPFLDMVVLLVKFALAAIPAAIILAIVGGVLFGIIGAVVGR